jgi:hypothetical protein
LTLLLPATTRFAGVALPPALAAALGRADRAMHEAGEDAQLARHFRLLPNRWAHAALTRVVDGGRRMRACPAGCARIRRTSVRTSMARACSPRVTALASTRLTWRRCCRRCARCLVMLVSGWMHRIQALVPALAEGSRIACVRIAHAGLG